MIALRDRGTLTNARVTAVMVWTARNCAVWVAGENVSITGCAFDILWN